MKQYVFKPTIALESNRGIPMADNAKIEAELKKQSIGVWVNQSGDIVGFFIFDPAKEKPRDISGIEDDRERVINILATMPGYTPEQAQVLMYAAKIAASDYPYDYIPAEMARSLATKVLPKTKQ